MIKLSERLKIISKEIKKGEAVADIGTDHGFLPIYLIQSGKCNKVIMTDISKGSLDKAKSDCKLVLPSYNPDLRLGDGLDALEYGEVDSCVIAGMGGILISEILEWDYKKTSSIENFILQPRNNFGYLIYRLKALGFKIEKIHLVREGKFICEIIKAKSPKHMNAFSKKDISLEEKIEAELPQEFLDCEKTLLNEYLNMKYEKNRLIECKIEQGVCDENKLKELDEYKLCELRKNRIRKLMELLSV